MAKLIGPSGGSQLSGGGIIILRVIRRHFLVLTPTVSLFRWLLFVEHVDLAAFRCMHASMGVVRPHCQPLTYSHLPMTLGC